MSVSTRRVPLAAVAVVAAVALGAVGLAAVATKAASPATRHSQKVSVAAYSPGGNNVTWPVGP
jgi:hypothetical protein